MNFIFSPDETLVDTCINVKELRIHNYTTLLTLCTRQGEILILANCTEAKHNTRLQTQQHTMSTHIC